jgi:uncharacterized protein (TIGR03083 family)
MPDHRHLARAERADLAAFLRTLTPEQWEHPSLCEGWRVRDVIAHMVSYEGLSKAQLASRFVRGRFWFDRMNAVGVSDQAGRTPQQLVQQLEAHLDPTGLATGFGCRVALIDALIHHQDIRRPLGLHRDVPQERLRVALPFAVTAPPIRGFWHTRGVRAVATDVDWATGRGPEARGTGEAVLMTLAGRRGAARELTGPGAARLVQRLG